MTPEQVVAGEDLAQLKRAIRAATRYRKKREWRRAVLLRTTRTAMTLRAIESVLGEKFTRREKDNNRRWSVFARNQSGDEVLVAFVGGGPTRRLEEVRAPIQIEVVAPALIDVEALRRATGSEWNERPEETKQGLRR